MTMASRASQGTAPIARALIVFLGTVVATTVVLRLFWAAGSTSLGAVLETGPHAPADLLVVVVCALGVAVTGWLGSTALIATLAALPGEFGRLAAHLADRLAPVAVRRAVALALGTALVAGLPAVAHAAGLHPTPAATSVAPAPAPDPSFTVTGPAPAVDGGPTPTPGVTTTAPSTSAPDPGFSVTTPSAPPTAPSPTTPATSATSTTSTTRTAESAPTQQRPVPSLGPLGPAPRAPSTAPATPSADASTSVRVARGDSLWRIAARHLGPDATAAQVAREWPRWYAANRAVIGASPHLIQVGQELTAPSAPTEGAGS